MATSRLVVIATGERNPDAQGAEVWIQEFKDQFGNPLDLELFAAEDGWKLQQSDDGTFLVASGGAPARAEWTGEARGKMLLVLITHQWSGKVKVLWNETELEADLYANGGVRILELPCPEDAPAASAVETPARTKKPAQVRHIRVVQTSHAPSTLHYLNPFSLIGGLWRLRGLIWQFTQRELMGRYKGSMLGLVWTLLTPLLMLCVYTFVFSVIFKIRWSDAPAGAMRADFALRMFCALIIFNVFAETVNRAPTLIVNSPNYVKKVVFPLEVLPLSVLGACLFTALMSAVILLIGEGVFVQRFPPWQIVYFPLVLLPLVMFTCGVAWFLASIGVFLRDVGHIISVVMQILFYVTPIFYSIKDIPRAFQIFFYINPLTVMVEGARYTLYLGQSIPWRWWGIVTLASWAVMQLGYAWLHKTKRGFADVI